VGKILTTVCTLSRRFPEMMIVPGTIVWADFRRQCRNTALVYLGGRIQTICHKRLLEYEVRYLRLTHGDGWIEGNVGYGEVRLQGQPFQGPYRCRSI
jgi:hypothetical protein